MQSYVCHQYFWTVGKQEALLLAEIFELFLSEVWVITGVSMNCGESVASVAPSIPLFWFSAVLQRMRKENWWGTAASDCAERVVWGRWEVRWLWMPVCETGLIYTQLWHMGPCAPLTVHTPPPAVTADDMGYQMMTDFSNSDHKSLLLLTNRKMDWSQKGCLFKL